MKTYLTTFCLVVPALLSAEDIQLEWMPTGFSMRVGSYRPMKATLSSEKPAGVTRVPEELASPLFGTLPFGPPDQDKKVTLLLDESAGGEQRLWLDANANGDLTDDAACEWTARTSESKGQKSTTYFGSAQLRLQQGDQPRGYGLKLYRFDKNDSKRAAMAKTILYYRDFGYSGQAKVGEKTYTALLSDDSARGLFSGPGSDATFAIDLNEDHKFDFRSERFSVNEPFNIGGTTYEITGLKPQGSPFQIVKSDKTVAEKSVPKALKSGTQVTAFEEKTTAGKPVKFPQDYKGRIVMLDFWATWCGPCIAELPNLTKVYAEFHDKGFDVLGVSLDDERTLPKLAKFTEDKGMVWPQIADGKGWEARLVQMYGVRGIPACFLVDGNTGNLIASENDLRGSRLRETVERAIASLGKVAPATPEAPKKTSEASPPKEPEPDSSLVAKAREMTEKGQLLKAAAFMEALKNPQPARIARVPESTESMTGRQIAARAQAAHLRVGWLYQCTQCSRWHTTLAGGYAISTDAVVTAHHVMEAPANMKEGLGYPVIVRGEDEILPNVTVIAADADDDAVILRTSVTDLKPLSILDDVQVGDSVFCLSDPRGVRDYFSTGIVNRSFDLDPATSGGRKGRRLHVSTDWAQGSSGSAILDVHGNAVGHVSRIRALPGAKPDTESTATTAMNLHEAVPASSVMRLILKAGMKNSAQVETR
ncbi:MAG: redoxin domain-containing protein [Verrucomicrobiota bacterium]